MLSLMGFIYTFYPLITAYFFPPPIKTIQASSTTQPTLSIPKIGAQAPIIYQVDPWNEAAYKKALESGVAQAKGTALPGEKGTTFIFAHSSGNPWELTRYNTIFLRLGELEKGDLIVISLPEKQLTYRVIDKKTVWPQEVQYLTNTQKDQLILQTCTPIGTSLQRLLVFATEEK